VRHPLGTSDFSSFLLQAQASREVVGLANAGGDTVNTIKQAGEFNLSAQQRIVALVFDLQSVPALGRKTAQGITRAQRILLGPQRPDPRLVQKLSGAASEKGHAQPHAGGRLLRDDGLPQGGRQGRLAVGWTGRRRRDMR
jgi:substrate-binding family protein